MSIAAVIPLYNKRGTILRCLQSVRAQTRAPDEMLVVDDGSTDGGGDLVAQLADPKIRLLRQPNGGASAARNCGIEAARSERIALLDADDEWAPGFLAAHAAAWAAHPGLAASFTNYRRCAGEPELRPAEGEAIALRDYFGFCLANRGKGMCSSVVVASRAHLRQVGGFPVGRTHGEDLDTWARLAWSGPIAFIPDCLATYHVDSGASGGGIADLDFTATHRDWQARGAIPSALRRTSAALAALNRFRTIHYLALAGRTDEGRRRLREMEPGRRRSLYGLSARLSLALPPAGRLAFRAAERVNRGCAWRQWEDTWR